MSREAVRQIRRGARYGRDQNTRYESKTGWTIPGLFRQNQSNKTPDHLSSPFWIVRGVDLPSLSSKHCSQYLRQYPVLGSGSSERK